MSHPPTGIPSSPRPLRVWPGAVLVVLQIAAWLVSEYSPEPTLAMYSFFGTLLAGVGIVVWWLFFSRAPHVERWGALLLTVAVMFLTYRILHPSIAGAGMGMLFYFLGAVTVTFALGLVAVASHRLSPGARRAVMAAAILVASGGWALVRIDGIRAAGGLQLKWRWSPTAEERLLAQAQDLPPEPAPAAVTPPSVTAETPKEQPAAPPAKEKAEPAAASAVETRPEWPGFRGALRDSTVSGTRIATDWTASPPMELWRRAVGPGWSSFAVRGGVFYTQEQRGEEEIVAAYNISTGEPVWMHRDTTRFWEANAGAGPRATPTLSGDRVYTFGATGMLNALDAATGALIWSRNVATDADRKVPYWGFAGSPLVVDGLVVVAASGRLVAYHAATGEQRWIGPTGGSGYASPHLATISGTQQIVLLNGAGAISVAPNDGKVLWEHTWHGDGILQPGLTPEGDILIGTATGMGTDAGIGTRRIAVSNGSNGWTAEERWTTNALKPYFNDLVIHKGHVYGFDGAILACIDLAGGTRKWKGGRYGHGQMVLLADQDLLLVLSEEGELALVRATPDAFTELARLPAIEGKTWNHPVLVGDVLLVRNDREMAAFRLAMAAR